LLLRFPFLVSAFGLTFYSGITFCLLMVPGIFAFDCLLSSAYFLLLVVLRISGYFFDRFGIVLLRLMFSEPFGISFPFFLCFYSGMPIDSIVLLQSIMPFTGCPVYERILPFDSCSRVIVCCMCLSFRSFFILHKKALFLFTLSAFVTVGVMSLPEVCPFYGGSSL